MTGTTAAVEVVHDAEHHLGTTVVDALGRAADVPPEQLDLELNDYLDPDALDTLFAPRSDGTPRVGGRVAFDVDGRSVVVDASDPDRVVVRVR